MSKVDCHKDIKKFHDENVALNKPQQDEMRSRRDAGRTRLKGGLTKLNKPQPADIASQGSYSMKTMTQDAGNDYDIDDGVYFNRSELINADGTEMMPLDARNMVCKALQQDDRLKLPAHTKNNCVRQEYPEGYHIDMPVYRVLSQGNGKADAYELASCNDWVSSDARAVTAWFNGIVGDLNAGASDGSQLRRVVRLTKKFARSRATWKKKTASGICITKLVVDHIVAVEDRDDESLRKTWLRIRDELNKNTLVKHPINGSDLSTAAHADVIFLRTCLNDNLSELNVLDQADCDLAKARKAWDKVFSTQFFSDLPDPNGGTSGGNKSSISVTSSTTARRNDDGGRFG